MPIPFVVQLLIGLALAYISYLLVPKPKVSQPEATKELENPTAEAGKPIPVVFGSITIQSPNNLGYWDKEIVQRDVPVDSGGKK